MKSQPSQKNNYHKLKKRLFFLKKNNLEKITIDSLFQKKVYRYIILFVFLFDKIKLSKENIFIWLFFSQHVITFSFLPIHIINFDLSFCCFLILFIYNFSLII